MYFSQSVDSDRLAEICCQRSKITVIFFPEVREHPGHDNVCELGHGVARSLDVAEGRDDDARRRRGGQDPTAYATLGPRCGGLKSLFPYNYWVTKLTLHTGSKSNIAKLQKGPCTRLKLANECILCSF